MFITETVKQSVLKWFTGKANVNAITALQNLEDSERAGEWLPGVSRTVRAALTKSNVAKKIHKAHGKEIEAVNSDHKTPRAQRGWEVDFMLQFGLADRGLGIDFKTIYEAAPAHIKPLIEKAEGFYQDFEPVNELIAQLDSARPKPVFTWLGISPTITETLKALNFNYSSPNTVRVCPMRFERVEQVDDKGAKYTVPVCILEWPANTVFGASKYAEPGDTWPQGQCHACGHGIKNDTNWVPLIIDDPAGIPHALWVGVDCCRTLFGIKVKGEIHIKRPEASS